MTLSSAVFAPAYARGRCRTAALGGHLDRCAECGRRAISFNSCRNRHCPKCLTHAREQWLANRRTELLPVGYSHVVFTLPHELSWLALQNKKVVYDLLFRASAATLLEVAADAKHLGAAIGFLSVLHTWGQNLLHHPHVHCVVPVGGLSPDRTQWVHPRHPFFLPVKVGGPEHVLQYLARYTHRVAISNHRIVKVADAQATFRWKDYVHGSASRRMTVSACVRGRQPAHRRCRCTHTHAM